MVKLVILERLNGILNKSLSRAEVECVWNLMAHGGAREGKWRGNWRMEWVASTLTLPRNVVYPASLSLMLTPRLPVVDRTDAPADLKGLVRFDERRNLVSACVQSRFKRSLQCLLFDGNQIAYLERKHYYMIGWYCELCLYNLKECHSRCVHQNYSRSMIKE